MVRIIETLAEISAGYDALLCDIWGVVHNGVRPNLETCAAIRDAVIAGKPVILLTNSPRPASHVERQIRNIGVPRDCWTSIVTSGDAARHALHRGEAGRRVYHIGPDVALGFFDPEPDHADCRALEPIRLVDFEAADGIVCTGLFDDTRETPEDYGPLLKKAVGRRMTLLCANPDIVVDRGPNRVYCAGALAALFKSLGGRVLMFGKPRAQIYELARQRVANLLPNVDAPSLLCIGDGILTDVEGASRQRLDCLFVTGGLSASETGTRRQPDPHMLDRHLSEAGASPRFAIGNLR